VIIVYPLQFHPMQDYRRAFLRGLPQLLSGDMDACRLKPGNYCGEFC